MSVLAKGSQGPEVEELHQQLRAIGYSAAPRSSSEFDAFTEAIVINYQRSAGLEDDGIVGDETRAALLADVRRFGVPELHNFRGRLGFTLEWEGHAGRPYWPRGGSGVTLDPGCDLRFHTRAELAAWYADVLTRAELDALELAIGVGPLLARELVHDPLISRIRIARLDAARVLPRIAAGYWCRTVAAVPALTLRRDAPAGAQTALLSLCFNAGEDDLAPLRAPAAGGDWHRVAELVGAMNASSESLSRRRRAEAALFA